MLRGSAQARERLLNPRRVPGPLRALHSAVALALAVGLLIGCGRQVAPSATPSAASSAPPAPPASDPGASSTQESSPVPTSPASPPPAPPPASERLATFGGGCFWCTEAVYLRLRGVLGVVSGYSGGSVERPTYEQVSSGTTGHAEVIQVRFDPAQVSYAQLLEVFFKTHDPTTLNRQGADVGTQYRSAIFVHDAEQRRVADEVKRKLDESGAYADPLVTEVSEFRRFYPAEDYHQDYYARNPRQGYCRAVVAPKVEKFEKAFRDLLKR